MQKRTKIVCTIGPASKKKSILKRMIQAGMDCARLNLSHGTYASHSSLIRNIREISKQLDQPVAIMVDLQGPRIRVGRLPSEGIKLRKGEQVTINCQGKVADHCIPTTYKNLYKDVKKGDLILLDDGLIELKVKKIVGKSIEGEVKVGGNLFSNKGINVPTASLSIPSLTAKDLEDLRFAILHDVEWVAMSFVKRAFDILTLRRKIKLLEKQFKIRKPTKIIAKIEKHEGVENFDQILQVSDGIMVARGDLGIETPIEKVPLVQKTIIDKCLAEAKPVITATQMLVSMVEKPRPTRAEVSDVANAVIDHTDAVMLSQETAIGRYPIEAVKVMSKVISETEESPYDAFIFKDFKKGKVPIDTAISFAATNLANHVQAKAIVIATISGYTARMVSRYRPELPIVVTAEDEKVRRQLALSWGVRPFTLPKCKSVDELINKAVLCVKRKKIIRAGDKVIIIGGQPVGRSGNVNLVKIHEVR